ncbi:hypothetical protein NEMBOFW57_003981 [Staphylotrichum longicolle]|uniref:Uncharacterized protein n=1 Tax=Staphylotrichum longicolle TaxID=669026 RepID=A0AAD4F5X9_9PEZI|nr:hypothetical protein NEMBOFW57_003981 [Staphylotrichum longicolle]
MSFASSTMAALSAVPRPRCRPPPPSDHNQRPQRTKEPPAPPHHTDLRPPRGCFKVTGSKGLSVRFAAEARRGPAPSAAPPSAPSPPSRPPPPPPDTASSSSSPAADRPRRCRHARPDPDKPPADRSVRWGPPLAPVPWKPR